MVVESKAPRGTEPHRQDSATPAVSVVVPTYCSSHHIADALHSIFRQSFRQFEVIVVNDGTPDRSELEAALTPFRCGIHYISQANAGPAAARNAGIRAARGPFVAFLDVDDRWDPDFLREQMKVFEEDPTCDLVYADALICGRSPLAGKRFMSTSPSRGPVTVESLLRQQCNVILSGVVARTAALIAVGLFDESLRRGQDFDLWLRLAAHGYRLTYQQKVLVQRYEQLAGVPDEAVADMERVIMVLRKAARTLPLSRSEAAALERRLQWATDRLEIEQAKREVVRRRFDAARTHLAALTRKTLKTRIAFALLGVAPELLRAYVYGRTHAPRSMRPSFSDQ